MPTEARGNYLPEAPYSPEHVSGAERQNFALIARRKAGFQRGTSGPQIFPPAEGLPIHPLIFFSFLAGIGYMRVC